MVTDQALVPSSCRSGCGATVYTAPGREGQLRCVDCGRAHYEAPVPTRPVPGAQNWRPMGQTGKPFSHVPIGQDEYLTRRGGDHVVSIDPVSLEKYVAVTGRVSLAARRLERPVAVEKLRPADLSEVPAAARTFAAVARTRGLRWDAYYQRVRPVSARSRLTAHVWEVAYVRVWPVSGRQGVMILRSWRTREGQKWQTAGTAIFRVWRKRAVGRPISAKEANEIIKTGVVPK